MALHRTERRGRARALQALYAHEMRGTGSLMRTATLMFDDLSVSPREREVAVQLLQALGDDASRFDPQIAAVMANWRFSRLGAVERAVLRLGAAELAGQHTPPRVVLQEFVRLAERFGGLESARFVNGVLDALARDMGTL
jgi:N utilization substance protein B